MSFSTFLADPGLVREWGDWLVKFMLTTEPVPGISPEILYLTFSRHGTNIGASDITIDGDTLAAHTEFEKRLLTAPTFQHALWAQGVLLDHSFPNLGQMVLNNRDGGLDQYSTDNVWVWADGAFKSYFGVGRKRAYSDLAGSIGKTIDGRLGEPLFGLTTVTVPILGHDARFYVPSSERVYRGGNWMLELSGDRTVSYGTPSAVNLTGAMSISMWLWINVGPTSDVPFWGWIGDATPWRVTIESDRKLTFTATIGGTDEVKTSTLVLGIGKPYHISYSIDDTTLTLRVWDDDEQTLTTETFEFSLGNRDTRGAGATYRLTSFNDASFSPWIDEAQVWNVTRTAEEFAADRFRPLGVIPASCVHYTRMDDATGTTVTDSSATAAHGTISGAGFSVWLWAHEGTTDLAGTPKPDVWGQKFGAKPVLVDPNFSGYQVGGDGAMEEFTVLQGGFDGYTSDGDAATYRAYLVATVAVGHILTYLPRGLFKLGGPPSLPLSVNAKGYNGSVHGYVDNITSIVTELANFHGPQLTYPGDFDTASFTAFETAWGYPIVGIATQQPTGINDLFDLLVRSGVGHWGFTRGSSDLNIARYEGPAVTADYNFNRTNIESEPRPIKWQRIREIVVRYQKSDVVLDEDEVAEEVKATDPTGWQRFTKEWLEVSRIDPAAPVATSRRVVFETALYYESAAVTLIQHLCDVLWGVKRGWAVTLSAEGLNVAAGKTCTLEWKALNRQFRLGLDGTENYLIMSMLDRRQEGKVDIEVLSG